MNVFEIYMNLFLLYLVVSFAKENKTTETKDPILGRKVPSIVFLQNQRLLKELVKEKLENDKNA